MIGHTHAEYTESRAQHASKKCLHRKTDAGVDVTEILMLSGAQANFDFLFNILILSNIFILYCALYQIQSASIQMQPLLLMTLSRNQMNQLIISEAVLNEHLIIQAEIQHFFYVSRISLHFQEDITQNVD